MEMFAFPEPKLRMTNEKIAITIIENASAMVILMSRAVESSDVAAAASR